MAWFAMAEFIKNFRNFASSNLLCASTPSAQDPIKELVILSIVRISLHQ
jgi:hypothetical protein